MKDPDMNEIIRNQFNRQAENFSNWSVTQNKDYLQRYFAACEMTPEDSLLDVACGSGEFVLFAAPRIKQAVGVDISDRMIELARTHASENHLTNVTFLCHDVSDIPADDSTFSMVVCKSAFHHIHDYDKIMSEMIRCCKSGGRVSLQDVVAYENPHVNDFFEEIERQVDISHHACLSRESIIALYEKHHLAVTWTFELTIELNFREYLTHAIQSEEGSAEIQRLLRIGLSDSETSQYLVTQDGELFYKRNVFLIMGTKS